MLSVVKDYIPSKETIKGFPRYLFIGFPQQLWKYFRYNIKSLWEHKFGYILGVLSCFIVVVSVTISITALNQIPVIFLRLAENSSGQYDFSIKNNLEFATSLNYTQVNLNIKNGAKENAEKFLHNSPRVNFVTSVIMPAVNCTFNGEQLPLTPPDSEWMYSGISVGGVAPSCRAGQLCAQTYCNVKVDGETILFDTEREKEMGFGRNWNFPRPEPGEIIISDSIARSIDANEGDWVVLQLDTYPILSGVWQAADIIKPGVSAYYLTMFVPFKIVTIFAEADNLGKQDSELKSFYIDYKSFLTYAANFTRQPYKNNANQYFPFINLDHYATRIFFNIENRIQEYNKNDYINIQNMVLEFGSLIAYFVGYDQIMSELPILVYLRATRFFSLFIGLIINIVVTILTILSIILIYSLLLTNVENRTFETGVLRMIGMQKIGIIQMVLMQAFLYSIPGLVLGLIIGQLAYLGINFALATVFEAPIPKILTPQSILLAVLLGVFIPILSSLLPINRALGQNLTDALDSTRSKTKAVKYNIERASDNKISWAQIVFGICCVVFGFGVYYAFPLALLSFNVTLLLYMFFGVLLGMLLGLVLLALNFENILERILAYIFFFWENSAIRSLVLKNLIAHRIRNRKTTIMYSLSLGFIIFVAVSFKLQISTFQYTELQKAGSRLVITSTNNNLNRANVRDPLTAKCNSSPYIDGCAYISHSFNPEFASVLQPNIVNLGRFRSYSQNMRAISPNFFSVADNNFLSVANSFSSGYDLSEQLYTSKGSYRMILGSLYRDNLAIDNLDGKFFFEVAHNTQGFPRYNYYYMKPMAFLNAAPAGVFSQFPSDATGAVIQNSFVSFPTFLKISNGTYDTIQNIPISKAIIRIKSGTKDSNIDRLKRELSSIIQGYSSLKVVDVQESLNPLNIASTVMDFFFLFVTIVAMILCYFSLISSMVTNINEQAKEIGILRAIGLGKFSLTRIYIYESFILVMTASVMGVFIGVGVSYTMTLQQILFTQLPITFFFPWQISLIVFGSALICAFLSSCFPIRRMLRKNIVQILRSN